jgi:hypothetical protein
VTPGFVLLVVVVCIAATVMAVWRNEGRISRERSATVELSVDALGVRRTLADGRVEGVDWDELTSVEVLTARMGPHAASGGVVMLGAGPERGALVPLDRLADTNLAAYLGALPEFDPAALNAASERRAPSRTEVWTHPGDASLPPD